MIVDLLKVVISFLESFLLYRFYDNLLTFRFDRKYRYVPFFVSVFAVFFRRFLGTLNMPDMLFALVKPIGMVSLVLIAIFLYKDSLKRKLLMAFLFLAITGVAEVGVVIALTFILSTPFTEFMNGSVVFTLCMLLVKIVTLLIIELIIYKTGDYKGVRFSYPKELAILLSTDFILFAVVLVVITDPTILHDYVQLILFIFLGCLVFTAILSCYLIMQIAKKSKYELESHLRIQHMEMEMKLNEDMGIMVDKLRSLRHDMNNHIGIMLGLSQTNQYQELDNYLSDMCDDISRSNDFIVVENKALMVLLNNKFHIASAANIQFDHNIYVQDIPLPDKDMCTLFGNLLDNAIEAASKVEDNRYIELVLKRKGSQLLLSCKNTFAVMPNKVQNSFITTKKDPATHGIGLKNIHHIVDKYQGVLDITYDELFNVTIILNVA